MKKYYTDANIFLRFILKDNPTQSQKASNYFHKAQMRQIELIFLPEVIAEIEYVLRKQYKETREKVAEVLSALVKPAYITIFNRSAILEALNFYQKTGVDFVDCILFATAREQNAQVISFDKDFKKLTKLAPH